MTNPRHDELNLTATASNIVRAALENALLMDSVSPAFSPPAAAAAPRRFAAGSAMSVVRGAPISNPQTDSSESSSRASPGALPLVPLCPADDATHLEIEGRAPRGAGAGGGWSLPWPDGGLSSPAAAGPAGSGARLAMPLIDRRASNTTERSSNSDRMLPPGARLKPRLSALSSSSRHSIGGSTSMNSVADVGGLLMPSLAVAGTSPATFHTPSAVATGGIGSVVPGTLFVGPFRAFCDGDRCNALGIKAYMCMAEELNPGLPLHARSDVDTGCAGFYKLSVKDAADVNIQSFVFEALSFVDAQVSLGRPVALYCQAGKSRSVTVALAFLMREYGMSSAEALEQLQAVYPAAEPNIFFFDQLSELNLSATRAAEGDDGNDEGGDDGDAHAGDESLQPGIISIFPPHRSPGPSRLAEMRGLPHSIASSPVLLDLPIPIPNKTKANKKKKPSRRSRHADGPPLNDEESAADSSTSSASSRSASPGGVGDGSLPASPPGFGKSFGSPKALSLNAYPAGVQVPVAGRVSRGPGGIPMASKSPHSPNLHYTVGKSPLAIPLGLAARSPASLCASPDTMSLIPPAVRARRRVTDV